jgi:hypothetical protein
VLKEVIMKKVSAMFAAFVLLAAGSALAACPDVIGIWSSNPETNPDFPLLNGRMSEAWCSGAGPLQPGNMVNAESWDGTALGIEWKLWGMTINPAGSTLVYDGVVGGNGVRIYQTAYDGGEFWLGGGGVWTNGDVELYGDILDFMVVATITYVGGQVVAEVCNITFNGVFNDCENECVIEFAIANAALIWRSDQGTPMPADYPAFLCSATAGELFSTSDITLGIYCPIATENQSWSTVREIFR